VTSRVDLTNRALAAIGTRSTIAAMDEGGNESNNASLVYDATRQELIRAAPWNFATATAQLALLKAARGTAENATSTGAWTNAEPPPGWSYQYAYPSDCLRARKVVPNVVSAPAGTSPIYPSSLAGAVTSLWDQPGVRFTIATDKDANDNPYTCVLVNLDQALICYLRDIAVEDLWDPMFAEAMVCALAGKLANPLTGDKALAKLMMQQANAKIMDARAADANESVTVIDHTPDWIAAGHGAQWPGGAAGYALPYGPLFGV
jgi:hypothetical protein